MEEKESDVLWMAMKTCQRYSMKLCHDSLTEYEMLMYESLCGMIKAYADKTAAEYRKSTGEKDGGDEVPARP